jgi:hypothetical protein
LVSIDKRAILAEFGHTTVRENSVQAAISVEIVDDMDQSIRWAVRTTDLLMRTGLTLRLERPLSYLKGEKLPPIRETYTLWEW